MVSSEAMASLYHDHNWEQHDIVSITTFTYMFYNTCWFLELTSICARMGWQKVRTEYNRSPLQILYEGLDLNEAPVDIDDDSGVEAAEVEEYQRRMTLRIVHFFH